MMNLEEIAGRIKNPNLCRSNDIEQLQNLSNKYPYAQAFSILYLKALSVSNDVRFDDELHQHAYRITDRMRLFELINEKEKSIPVLDNPSEKEIIVEITASQLEEITPINEEISLISEIIEQHKIEPIEATESIEEIEDEIIEEEIELVAIPAIQNEEPEIILEVEEEEIIQEESTDFEISFDSVTNTDEEAEITEEIIPDTKEEESTIEAPVQDSNVNENPLEIEVLAYAISSNYAIENTEIKEEVEEVEVEKSKEIEEVDFTKTVSTYSLENNPPKKAFSSWLKSNINENERDDKDPKAKINNLLNQFLKEEPSISRPQKEEKEVEKPKTEFFSPVKKARKSLDENSLPVSETLAKIFAAQGNFPKAIYAYEQLIVINPEKKIFFANQIEELTKKLNT